jgi:FkbM family methyltransferase
MNKGEFATVMRDRYGCSVSGVEANPSLAEATSNLRGIRCKNAVISGSDGSVEFFINPTDSEASKIVTFQSIDTLVMPCVSLSTFFREIDADEVDLLKIDIEGAELDLIETADPDDLLRCAQITIEFHSFVFPEQASRVEGAITKLSDMGFYHIDFSMRRMDVLFINNRMIELSKADKCYLALHKYHSDVKRRLSRLGGLR